MKNSIFGLLLFLGVSVNPPVTAQKPPSPSPTPPKVTQPQRQRSTWEAILSLFRKKGQNLGSRGVCPISPGLLEDQNIIWNDRPLFLWQGLEYPSEIRLYSPFSAKQEEEILWRQVVTAEQGIFYTGPALQPGKTYDWEIFSPSNGYKLRRSFQVMDLDERQLIIKELQVLENRLRAEQATESEISLERVNYFAQRELWSDALQSMYSIPNPPPEVTQKIEALLQELCEPIKSDRSAYPPIPQR
jgi:hypothetical protein